MADRAWRVLVREAGHAVHALLSLPDCGGQLAGDLRRAGGSGGGFLMAAARRPPRFASTGPSSRAGSVGSDG